MFPIGGGKTTECGGCARVLLATALTFLCACYHGGGSGAGAATETDASEGSGASETEAGDGGAESTGEPACDPDEPGGVDPPQDFLSHGRLLRRTTLALANRFPSDDELEELYALPQDARDAWISELADDLLDDPAFYDAMFEFGSDWISMPLIPNYADEPEYSGAQAQLVVMCGENTAMAGRWTVGAARCSGVDTDGEPLDVHVVEPWWDEGTQIEVVGRAGNGLTTFGSGPDALDCGDDTIPTSTGSGDEGCGCGPNLVYCYPGPGNAAYSLFFAGNPEGQRRLLWEEPARLLAHIVWHDRPLDDVITGTYSVGPSRVQSAYVRWARRTGADTLDDDASWWRASGWSTPADPGHAATDPMAWSEFDITDRHPYLLRERDVTFDPRTQPREALEGIPSAGVLTSLGMLAAYPRERVRAARMLETFACEEFVPPPGDIEFEPYLVDAATEGTCQHCHVRIDPAAIHFKRIQRSGSINGRYHMLGIGEWMPDDNWTALNYPWHAAPWPRLERSFVPGTRMTPVSEAAAQEDSYRLFLDFLPADQTLLGATGDGTVGPLGFGKLLIASGAFDRCAVRRLHELVVGRDIDPTTETGYLSELTGRFVDGGRNVRSFIRHLVTSETFKRGL